MGDRDYETGELLGRGTQRRVRKARIRYHESLRRPRRSGASLLIDGGTA